MLQALPAEPSPSGADLCPDVTMADHVFIGYSRKDKAFVWELAGALKRRGVPVWLDEWNLVPGSDWDQGVDDALESCARMLVVLSPDAVTSREVRGEIRVVHDAGKPIVPLIHVACRIPRQLAMIHAIDFTGRDAEDQEGLDRLVDALGGAPRTAPNAPAGGDAGAAGVFDWRSFMTRPPFESTLVPPAQDPAAKKPKGLWDLLGYETPPSTFSESRQYRPLEQLLGTPSGFQAEPPRIPTAAREQTLEVKTPVRAAAARPDRVGRINHFWDRISVAGIDVEDRLAVGDIVRIHGPRTDFAQRVGSIERKRVSVDECKAGDRVGLEVVRPVEEGDEVHRVAPLEREAELEIGREKGEKLAGEVLQYFARPRAASVVLIEQLQVGDRICVRGATTDFIQTVASLQVDRKAIKRARAVILVGLGVEERVRPGDLVYRLR